VGSTIGISECRNELCIGELRNLLRAIDCVKIRKERNCKPIVSRHLGIASNDDTRLSRFAAT
jgi:hypothetical protein